MTLILFVLGAAALVAGAELLVRGASKLALAAGISPLVVGLTVVAFGTSSPELSVSVLAGIGGRADLALGNVVGSSIFNVLFILGISALIAPMVVAQRVVWLDVPILIGVSFVLLLLALDGRIGTLDGVALVTGILAFTVFLIRASRREGRAVKAEYREEFGEPAPRRGWIGSVALVAAGLALLLLGSRWLVDTATAFAAALGISELVIGLTIIAAGTSLPEVATSILASFRGERDIAVGNVVGSNIFNILGILGTTALVSPGGVPVAPSVVRFDIPVMIAAAVACLPIFFTGHRIGRREGAVFLAYYFAYTVYLLLSATEHDALPAFSRVMAIFVLPLTAATLCLLFYRELRARRG